MITGSPATVSLPEQMTNLKTYFHRLSIALLCLALCIPYSVQGKISDLDTLRFGWGSISFQAREEALARSSAQKISQTIRHMEDQLNLQQSAPFQVVIAPTQKVYHTLTGALPDWSAGATDYRYSRIILKSPKAGHTSIWGYDETLQHEVAHMVIGQNIDPDRLPRWLNEGLAMLMAGQQSLRQTYILSQGAIREQLIPLSEIEQVLGFQQSRANLAYAEALSAVQFFLNEFPDGTLQEIFRRLRTTEVSFDQALWDVTGVSSYYFEVYWKEHVHSKYQWIIMLSSETTLWILFPLLALAAYLMIRWRNSKKLKSWQEEEDHVDSGTDWDYEYMPDPDDEWRGDKH